MHHLCTRGGNPSICSPAALRIPRWRSEIKHTVQDGPSTCIRRSRMNHDHDSLFSLSLPKQKPWVLSGPQDQQWQPSSRCPCTFLLGKCHQQVRLTDKTGMHILFVQMTKTHDAGHASTGPKNTSLRCPQTISSQVCSNALHIRCGAPCCTFTPNYPIESPGQFA